MKIKKYKDQIIKKIMKLKYTIYKNRNHLCNSPICFCPPAKLEQLSTKILQTQSCIIEHSSVHNEQRSLQSRYISTSKKHLK